MFLQDSRIQNLLSAAAQKQKIPESQDLVKFQDVGLDNIPDLSVFETIRFDAGCSVPTQAITRDHKDDVNGPYFKINESGVKKFDLKHMVVEQKPKNIASSTEETAGSQWFNMKATEMTPEIKRDLLIIKNRAALDPKHFYKKDNSKKLPKYFQFGTIIESKSDFYSARLSRKQRKQTLVDTLLADYEHKQYLKGKFLEIQHKKQSNSRKPTRKTAKNRQNKY